MIRIENIFRGDEIVEREVYSWIYEMGSLGVGFSLGICGFSLGFGLNLYFGFSFCFGRLVWNVNLRFFLVFEKMSVVSDCMMV